MTNAVDRMAAHHEAGHAVAFLVLGLSFEKVRLDRDGLGGGTVISSAEHKRMRLRAFHRIEPDHDRVRRDIVGVIAGPAAQDRFNQIYCRFKRRRDPGYDPACQDDWELAWLEAITLVAADALVDVVEDDVKYAEATAIMHECGTRADTLVADHWSSIRAVAGALLERGPLTHAEVREIVQ